MRRSPLLPIVLIAALLLTACGSVQKPSSTDTSSIGGAKSASALDWEKCGAKDAYFCATVAVPLDWDAPDGETIDIALKKNPASNSSKRLGSILINPGGPGGSGVNMVDHFPDTAGDSLVEHYDIIGFDPRGVNQSEPVMCFSDKETDEFRAESSAPATAAGLAESKDWYKRFAEACQKNSADVMTHVDTISAAKDLEALREALGEDTLNYLGFSYGTKLGITYADMFPDKVGRFVLDGALDPELTYSQLSEGQAVAFDGALKTYVSWCLKQKTCPLSGSVDSGMAQIQKLLDDIEKKPLPTTDSQRPLTLSLALSGLILPMYAETLWPTLSTALQGAMNGNGAALLVLADYGADREANGTYKTNSDAANLVINCLDYPTDPDLDTMRVESADLQKKAPFFGQYMGYGALSCEYLPKGTHTPARMNVADTEPIVVVGTTGDPATPYQWAKSMREQIENSSLVTYVGDGHTAYGRNTCITAMIDEYFVDGTVPKDGARCTADT